MQVLKLKKIITKNLDENKAKNIVVISLKNKSQIADFMIIFRIFNIYRLYLKTY